MTTPTHKTELPFRVTLLADHDVDKDIVRAFYRLVQESIGETLMGSIQVERPGYGLDNVRLVHKTCSSGSHVYDIPLLRNLTDKEYKALKKAFQDFAVGGMVLDSSTQVIKNIRHLSTGGTQMQPEAYTKLCDTVAKHQHSNWCRERTDNGWKYGTTHNSSERTSPMIRPWEDLPETYRRVDANLPQYVFDQLESLGYVIIPADTLKEIIKKNGTR